MTPTLIKRYSDIKGWITEWICPHGVGHDNNVHGCDGCCRTLSAEDKEKLT